MTADPPDVTVVVVTWRGAAHIAACLDSLLGQSEAARILVIDNASDDGTQEILRRYQQDESSMRVVRTAVNLGFAGGVAHALELVDTPLVALLNDDAVADPDWLAALHQALAEQPDAAAATSRMRLADSGLINNAGVALTASGYGYDIGLGDDPANHAQRADVFGFCGGAALLRTDALRTAGGFPASFFMYYEDTDTSWRLRLHGWTVTYQPTAEVLHQHGASAGPATRMFAFHNERNRLWMLIRCAPAGVAARQLGRFALTTASLTLKGALGRRPPGWQFSTRLRLTVLGSTLRSLPALARQRRAIPADGSTRRHVWAAAEVTP